MSTQDLSLFNAMTTKMKWLEARQNVLAQNIANADTPNYKPQDLKPLDFKDILSNSSSRLALSKSSHTTPSISVTRDNHIALNGSGGNGAVKSKEQKHTYEVAPAGNSVILEEQLLKANETAGDYRLITNLYQKQVNMLRTALGQN